MKRFFTLFTLLLLLSLQSVATVQPASFFIENKGQWPEEILFATRMGGMNAWITKTGVVYDFYQVRKTDKKQPLQTTTGEESPARRTGQVVRWTFQHSSASIHAEGRQRQTAHFNYFLGSSTGQQAALFKEVVVKNVYRGIDVRYYFDGLHLRYDYIVHPNADVQQIRINIQGTDGIHTNRKGELVTQTRLGEVVYGKLFTYQQQGNRKQEIQSRYVLTVNGTAQVLVGAYDNNRTLIIDPLVWSTFIGGTGVGDAGYEIKLDADNNIYVLGETSSSDYPTTTGAYDVALGGTNDLVVSKLSANGSTLLFSTFIGGSSTEGSGGIAVDIDRNIYVTGQTSSTNFPTTAGAYDQTSNGSSDAFVLKLNATGSALLYSTYIGGSSSDNARDIRIDADNNVYITGQTSSTNFPTTTGAYDRTQNGSSDAYVAKLNAAGSALVFSTFIGGSSGDIAYSLELGAGNEVFVAGGTGSTNFPTTAGAYRTTITSSLFWDAFVTRLNATGTALVHSTYLGGSSGAENADAIALDATGVYIVGRTQSNLYPTTDGAFDRTHKGNDDGFVTKMNLSLSTLLYSTFFGGSNFDRPNSMVLTPTGEVLITGETGSTDFPTTPGCLDNTFNNVDAFVTHLNATGSALVYSTYLGGGANDGGAGIALDAAGTAYITGQTNSSDFPVTNGVYDGTYNGGFSGDLFVAKLQTQVATSVQDVTLQRSISLYPNPARETVLLSNVPPRATIQVCDLSGRVLLHVVAGQSQVQLPVMQFISGVYLVRITHRNQTATHKLVVE